MLGGRTQANSGATPFYKGDVMTDVMLIECKTHMQEKKSFSIKRSWIDDIKKEAFAMGKGHWALNICYGDDEQFYVIDENTMMLLHEKLEETYNANANDTT